MEYAAATPHYLTRKLNFLLATIALLVVVIAAISYAKNHTIKPAPRPIPPPIVTTTDWVARRDGNFFFCEYRITLSGNGPIAFGWDNPTFPGTEQWAQLVSGEYRLHILRDYRGDGSLAVMDLLTGPGSYGGAQLDQLPAGELHHRWLTYSNLVSGPLTLTPGKRVNLLRATSADGLTANLWLQVP